MQGLELQNYFRARINCVVVLNLFAAIEEYSTRPTGGVRTIYMVPDVVPMFVVVLTAL